MWGKSCVIALAIGLPVVMGSCAAPPPVDPAIKFAVTATDVTALDADPVVVNLLFVADPNHEIWQELEAVAVAGQEVPFELVQGSTGVVGDVGTRTLANLAVRITSISETSFTEISLSIDDETVVLPVGSVTVRPAPLQALTPVGDHVLLAPDCGTQSQEHLLPEGVTVTGVTADSVPTDLTLTTVLVGNHLATTLDVSCTPDIDTFSLTPRVELQTPDGPVVVALDTISVGLQPDENGVARIANRSE